MNFQDAVRTVFRKYADFEGRATRPEYWWFVLFSFLVQIGIAIVIGLVSEGLADAVSLLFMLAVLVPTLAVGARRLHDTDRSGWWQLVSLVPLVGIVVLIVFFCLPGTPGPNRFDRAPAPVLPEL